jgi:hypothetical protein
MKKKRLRITAMTLLIILGLTAMLGGWGLIDEPSGSNLTFTTDMLEKTPFRNFLIPGIILFTLVGVLSLVIAGLVYYKVKNHPWYIIFEGVFLTGWLTVEVLLGFFFAYLHFPYYAIGFLLIIIGFLLKNKEPESSKIKIS